MITVRIKLYSILRQKYGGQTYNAKDGIEVSMQEELSIIQLCEKLNIDPQDVACVTVNQRILKDKNIIIKDGDVLGMHFHLPLGG